MSPDGAWAQMRKNPMSWAAFSVEKIWGGMSGVCGAFSLQLRLRASFCSAILIIQKGVASYGEGLQEI